MGASTDDASQMVMYRLVLVVADDQPSMNLDGFTNATQCEVVATSMSDRLKADPRKTDASAKCEAYTVGNEMGITR